MIPRSSKYLVVKEMFFCLYFSFVLCPPLSLRCSCLVLVPGLFALASHGWRPTRADVAINTVLLLCYLERLPSVLVIVVFCCLY